MLMNLFVPNVRTGNGYICLAIGANAVFNDANVYSNFVVFLAYIYFYLNYITMIISVYMHIYDIVVLR